MWTAPCRESIPNTAALFARLLTYCCATSGRLLAIALLLAAVCAPARAQYVGYVANSTDGTVSVFAVVTSGPTFGNMAAPGNEDNLIATINVGRNPSRIAVT